MIIQKIGLLAANSTNIQAYVWYTHKHTHTHTQSSAASCAYSRLSKETTMLSHVHTHTHTHTRCSCTHSRKCSHTGLAAALLAKLFAVVGQNGWKATKCFNYSNYKIATWRCEYFLIGYVNCPFFFVCYPTLLQRIGIGIIC